MQGAVGALAAPRAWVSVTVPIAAAATPTFAVFVHSTAAVDFDPASHRVFVRFRDGDASRGARQAWP